MSLKSHRNPADLGGLEQFFARIAALTSRREVRPVVTPSGLRARGYFPSVKSAAARARFESLLEQDVLRVIEVGTLVKRFSTHPVVLALPGRKVMHYTPDAQLELASSGALLETKATFFLKSPESRDRLLEVSERLAAQRIPFFLVHERDVQVPALQDELKELLRLRPVIGRRRLGIDTDLWDPLGCSAPDFEMERRWRAAQTQCDELLQRVMRRDPGQVIAEIA